MLELNKSVLDSEKWCNKTFFCRSVRLIRHVEKQKIVKMSSGIKETDTGRAAFALSEVWREGIRFLEWIDYKVYIMLIGQKASKKLVNALEDELPT